MLGLLILSRLKKLGLLRQHCLKLLNPFGFGLEDKPMFRCGQGKQISWSVVCGNTIEVMNNPPFGQDFTLCGFPYIKMFRNIACLVRLMVIRFINLNITLPCFKPTTLPTCSPFAFAIRSMPPAKLSASNNQLAANRTRMMISELLQIIFMGIIPFRFLVHSLTISRKEEKCQVKGQVCEH